MQRNSSKRSLASCARGFAALWAVLVGGIAFSARPAEAAPFAYVANSTGNSVSAIDTATNTVVGSPIPVGSQPTGVAVTPDGIRAYVTDRGVASVSVIATATNALLATVTVGLQPIGVAVTPDGTRVYVANRSSNTVSVIATATDNVVATVKVGSAPFGVAVTPDGKHVNANTVSVIATATNAVVGSPIPVGVMPEAVAITPDGTRAYVANNGSNTVSVIATATNTVVKTIMVGTGPVGVAITPDGTHAYVANQFSNNVSVIATATNTVVATINVGSFPFGVAVTPDGTRAYVANSGSFNVSVIATATNTVAATVVAGNLPFAVAIRPPSKGISFSAFNARLEIDLDQNSNRDSFDLQSTSFALASDSGSIIPVTLAVTLRVGTFTTIIPPGSFKAVTRNGVTAYLFKGMIGGVDLKVLIEPEETSHYALRAEARGANLTGTRNPVPVTLGIGDDGVTTSVKADIDH